MLPIAPLSSVNDQLLASLMMGGDGIGGESILLTNNVTDLFKSQLALSLKPKARYCLIMVVSDNPDPIVAQYLECPSINYSADLIAFGMPLGNHAILEVKGVKNLSNFRVRKVGVIDTTKIIVHYYA